MAASKYIFGVWGQYDFEIHGFVYGIVLFSKLFLGVIWSDERVSETKDRLERSLRKKDV